MSLHADLVALVLAAIAFLAATGSVIATLRESRRAWRDWETWAASERQRIANFAEDIWNERIKNGIERIDARLDEAQEANQKAQAHFARAIKAAKASGAVEPDPDRSTYDPGPATPKFPLPSQVGIDPEEAATRQRQAAAGIEAAPRDRNGRWR